MPDYLPIGSEFRASSDTNGGDAVHPVITALTNGRIVVSWYDNTGSLNDEPHGVYARIYNADGTAFAGTFLVPTITQSGQTDPSITALAGGGFVITWTDYGHDGGTGFGDQFGIMAQVFDGNGARVGGQLVVNSTLKDEQVDSSVAALGSGGFVVTWTDVRGAPGVSNETKAQIYDAAGNRVGGEFSIGVTPDGQSSPVVIGLSNGNFVVCWNDPSGDGNGSSLTAQIYSAGGTALGSEFIVNESPANSQEQPALAAIDSGGFIVAWVNVSVDHSDDSVQARIFAADGTPLSGDIRMGGPSTVYPTDVAVAALASGDFIVTWANFGHENDYGVVAQLFDSAGTPAGIPFRINGNTNNVQRQPEVVALEGGGFAITWIDGADGLPLGADIKVQIYAADPPVPVSQPPVNSVPGAQLVDEDALLTFSVANGNPISMSDANAGPSDVLNVTLSVLHGTLTITTLTGLTFTTGDGAADTTMNFHGTQNDINGALATLVYAPTANYNGSDTLTVTTNDVYGTPGGRQDVDTVAITVNPINDILLGYQPRGSEFLVNTTTADKQLEPTITALADGGFVVSWISYGQDGISRDVHAQIYAADGGRIGGEFLVNSVTAGHQLEPVIGGLSNGGFVIAWQDLSGVGGDPTSGIKAQIFAANGTRIGGEFLVNSATSGNQAQSTITGLANGNFVVSWTDYSGVGDTDSAGVKAQIFTAAGAKVGTEFVVNSDLAGHQWFPTVTALANGGFVVSWHDDRSDATGTLEARIFTANGTPVGSEFFVSSVGRIQQEHSIAGLADGGFVITWTDYGPNGVDFDNLSSPDIRAQIFAANGSPVGSAFLVGNITDGHQAVPTVEGLADGSFVISWYVINSVGGDGSSGAIKARNFAADGSPIGDEFLVNTTTYANQTQPAITSLPDGGFAIVWVDQSELDNGGRNGWGDIRAQMFAPEYGGSNEPPVAQDDAFTTSELNAVNGNLFADNGSGADSDADGPVLAVAEVNGIAANVGTQITLVSGALLTVNADGTFAYNPNGAFEYTPTVGSGALNVPSSDSFTYTLSGGGTARVSLTINGTDNNDYILGTAGSDLLTGGVGDDTIDGVGGDDTAIYANATGAVQVGLFNNSTGNGSASGADGNDTLRAIENITGSAFNDSLTGNTVANVLIGGDGNDGLRGRGGNDTLLGGNGADTLTGGFGDDVIDGGTGFDRSTYFQADPVAGGVTVSLLLQNSWQNVGSQGLDYLIGIENLSGTPFADILTGDSGNNWLWGSVATIEVGNVSTTNNDVLDGGDGNDIFWVGIGNHSIIGGSGIDTLRFTENGQVAIEPGLTVSLASQGVIQSTGNGDWTLSGIENLSGGNGNDTLTGDGNANQLAGSLGADTLVGGGGDDLLLGDGSLDFDASNVIVPLFDIGVPGNDLLEGGLGNDTIVGGGGIDTASYANASGGVAAFLYQSGNGDGEASGADGNDTLSGIENITGSAFDDSLAGDNFSNVIDGGDGHDGLRGNGGNDVLRGGNGDDFLNGGLGDDTIDGGAGFDRAAFYTDATAGVTVDLNLQGVAQNTGQGMDTLIGIENASGSFYGDTLTGDGGDNWLWGSASTFSDGTVATTNNDTLIGGGGNDLLTVGIGNHILDGGTGTDTLSFSENGAVETGITVSLAQQGIAQSTGNGSWTLTGIENLSGGTGNDALAGDGNANVLAGSFGNDVLGGGAGNDILYGDGQIATDNHGLGTSGPITTYADASVTFGGIAGNDILEGGLGDDLLDGGGGIDTASYANASGGVTFNLRLGFSSGADGNDTLVNIENGIGSQFNDNITGTPGENMLDGLGGNDFISGGVGNDTIYGGDGDDFLQGDFGENNILFTGDDLLIGGNGNDGLRGGLGNDTLIGGANNDNLRGNGGVDSFDGGSDDGEGFNGIGDRVSFFEQRATQGAVADLRTGIISNDGFGNVETMVGIESLGGNTAFADTFYGNDERNFLAGDRGDQVYGFGGDDIFQVTSAAAVIDGGAGTDRLNLFSTGQWLIPDTNADGLAEFAAAATAGWTVNLTAGTIADGQGNSGSITGIENVNGGHLGDSIVGDANANVLSGIDGNDTLEGGGGNDTIDGGNGIDTASFASAAGGVSAGLGVGGSGGAYGVTTGSDSFSGIENITGSAFNDQFGGNADANLLSAGDGHDILAGRAGNDTLIGGNGDDYLRGDEGDDIISGGAGWDRVVYHTGATGGVTIDLNLQGVAQNMGSMGIDTFTGIEHASGTAFNDTIIGDGGDNWLRSWGGDDTISGGDGNDLIETMPGNNVVDGGNGIDTWSLYGEGIQIPSGATASLALQGVAQDTGHGMMLATGFENLSGSVHGDVLSGNSGDNIIGGDQGNDTLSGGAGNDTLYGDGAIFVDLHGNGGSGPITTFVDVTVIDPSFVAGNDLLEGGLGNDIINGGGGTDTASYANASGGVTVTLTATGGSSTGADGDDSLVSIENVTGSAFNDTLRGNASANELAGGDGHDSLSGNDGDDTLQGGAGNDSLNGGAGDDIIDGGAGFDRASYNVGAAAGVIVNLALTSAQNTGRGLDTLIGIEHLVGTIFSDVLTGDGGDNWLWGGSLGTGVTGNDTIAGGDGNDLIEVGTGNHTLSGGNGTDILSFFGGGSDISVTGVTFSLASAAAQNSEQGLTTATGFENLSGSIHDDAFTGDAGSNVLAGNGGADHLIGGDGNDFLYGDGGFTTFTSGGAGTGPIRLIADVTTEFGGVGGNDLLEGGLGNDTLDGGNGSDTASYANAAGGVSVNLGSGTASGADGNDTLLNIENVTGSQFGDDITGTGNGNVLDGLGGNDFISGGAGDDTISGGDGNDFLNGDFTETNISSSGNDLLDGGNGNDNLRGGLGNDQLYGGANNDLLRGNGGIDSFDGGADDGEGVNGIGDRISFFEQRATQGAVADLRTGIISNDGFGNVETMVGIESLGGDTAYVDTFYGDDNRNYLTGSLGDNLYGFGGDDFLQMSAAAAVVDGGFGTDVLALHSGGGWLTPDTNANGLAEFAAAATAGWMVNLAAGTSLDGYGNGGSVSGIENVSGGHLGDHIIGDANANVLSGVDGDDTLEGGGGNDTLDGGNGIDTASFTNASGAVVVSLVANPAGYGFASGADGSDALRTIENITGSAYNDALTGDTLANVLSGGDGNDRMIGGGGNDGIYGDAGADNITGGEGDDILAGGAGSDLANYYPTSFGAPPNGVTVSLLQQGAAQSTGQGTDTLTGIENLSGTTYADTLTGDAGANWLSGASSLTGVWISGGSRFPSYSANNNDILDGGDGDDLLTVGIGNHTLIGGAGIDTVRIDEGEDDNRVAVISLVSPGVPHNTTSYGTWTLTGIENLSGHEGEDRFTGDANANILAGDGGNDTLVGGAGNDTLFGDGAIDVDANNLITTYTDVAILGGVTGNDLLEGGLGNDLIHGGGGIDTASFANAAGSVSANLLTGTASGADGNDTLVSIENIIGSAFDDIITGNDGNNLLVGGVGNDAIRGGAGDDTLIGGVGADTLDGGTGVNTIDYSASSAAVSVNLGNGKGSGGDANGDVISNVANVIGSAFQDKLIGNSLSNVLNGGANNDQLIGGGGADSLSGGGGSDTFIFTTITEFGSTGNFDRIMDFDAGGSVAGTQVDIIDLSAIDANSRTANRDDPFTYIGSAQFTNTAGQLRYDAVAGTILGDVNGDGVADFTLNILLVGTLSSSDFIL